MQHNYLHLLFLLSATALNAADSANAASSSSMSDDAPPVYTVYSPKNDCLVQEHDRSKQSLSLSLMRKTDHCTVQKIEDKDNRWRLRLIGNNIYLIRDSDKTPINRPFRPLWSGKASMQVSGGYLRNMQDQDGTSYIPAMHFLLVNNQRLRRNSFNIEDEQLTSLAAVTQQLRNQQCEQPTLIVDLQQWLVNCFGQQWRDDLPVKQVVYAIPKTVSWFWGSIQFKSPSRAYYYEATGKMLQEIEQQDSLTTIEGNDDLIQKQA